MADIADRQSGGGPPPNSHPIRPRLRDVLLIAIFLLTMSAPAVMLLLGIRPGNYLNRSLALFPALTLEALADATFFDGIDDFMDDNFPGRPRAVGLRATLSYRLGFSAN